MNKYSSYLRKKKPLIKELVKTLGKDYDFVSVLGTDVKSKSYSCNKSMSSIRNSSICECGFVARVFKNNNYFEYSFNEINTDNLKDIVKNIKDLVKEEIFVTKVHAKPIIEEPKTQKFMRKTKGKEYSSEEIMAKLREELEYGLSLGEEIVNVSLRIEFSEYCKMYISKDKDLEQYYSWINAGNYFLVANDDGMKYSYGGQGFNDTDKAFEYLHNSLSESYDLAKNLLSATAPVPGRYTIITDPSITGLIAHEAFGHGVEMDQFVKDRAKGAEFIGQEVASPILSMHDGAKAVISAASYFFDDEGVLAKDTKVINKGILLGGICDSVSASILNYRPTGNGRRESYRNKAYTRMTNTFFEKGKDSLQDMIKSVEYGYYIGITNNGMEDPKNWGIQCTALYGKEIKDGKFTGKYVSPVVMSGYVIDLLKSISMISKDNFEIEGSGSCGKGYKEWVRVSDGGASIKAEVKIG